jgi:hypothetical protein
LRLITGKPTFVYIDQFEEALTLCSPEDRAAFLDLVLPPQGTTETDLRIIGTLRADFFQLLLNHPDAGPRIQGRRRR